MSLHTANDIARNTQRSFDGLLPVDTEIEFQDACNSLAVTYDREGDTAELIAVLAGAERVLNFLTSAVEVPAHLLPSLRDLLDKQAQVSRHIERETRVFGRDSEPEGEV